MMTSIVEMYELGLWVPAYYGLKFRPGKRDGEFGEVFGRVAKTLSECQAMCDELNRQGQKDGAA